MVGNFSVPTDAHHTTVEVLFVIRELQDQISGRVRKVLLHIFKLSKLMQDLERFAGSSQPLMCLSMVSRKIWAREIAKISCDSSTLSSSLDIWMLLGSRRKIGCH